MPFVEDLMVERSAVEALTADSPSKAAASRQRV